MVIITPPVFYIHIGHQVLVRGFFHTNLWALPILNVIILLVHEFIFVVGHIVKPRYRPVCHIARYLVGHFPRLHLEIPH
jgi:hypothetical protein